MSDTFDHYGDALESCLDDWDGITYIEDYVDQNLGKPIDDLFMGNDDE